MRRLSVLGLVAVVLLGGMVLPGTAMADAQGANESNAPAETSFGETQFVVTVFDNGSARFTQRYNQQLTNASDRQNFRAYAERFNSEETTLYTDFRTQAAALTGEGSNATGRRMVAQSFTREAQVTAQPTATGVVEMSFLWSNFTATDGDRLTVGDAFENGLYLSPEMSLELRAGPDLNVDWESVEPAPDASTNGSANESDSLTYFGETQFASGQPRVSFVPESSMGGDSSLSSEPMMLLAGVLVALLLLGAVVVRRADTPIFSRRADRTDATETVASSADNVPEATATADTDVGDVTDATEQDTEEPTPTVGPSVTDEELQSDEDRVFSLLEANGGRMRQSAIVAETGWSKSKVSMLLSEMEDAGLISKLRVGRENIVSLEGHEPAATRSPFEDN